MLSFIYALLSIPFVYLFVFFATSSLWIYSSYATCLWKAFKEGTPRRCYWLGWFIIVVGALLSLAAIIESMSVSEGFVKRFDSPRLSERVAAIGNLGEGFSPTGGLHTPHIYDDVEQD